MTRGRKTYSQKGRPQQATASLAVSADAAHVARIEAAMSKIARALPYNAALSPVWARLEQMLGVAVTKRKKETDAQTSARAWLAAQNEMSAKSAAVSASGKPAP